MKISILVPVYGVEEYIERCAESLFKQTYQNLEYIFVNDCTPDKSIDILRSIMEKYPERKAQVHIITNDKNRGVGYTRASALNSATGDAVMIVDSDDYIPVDAAELMAKKMKETDADIVDGGYREVRNSGISDTIEPCQVNDQRKYLSLLICQDLVTNRMWGRLIKRRLFTDHDINTVEGIDFSEDYSLMTRLVFFAKRETIKENVYYYNMTNMASYTHNASEKHCISYIRSNKLAYDFFRKNDVEGIYRLPIQIGMTNMLRNLRRNNFAQSKIDELFPYRPSWLWFRFLASIFRNKCPFSIANFIYLATRRIASKLIML
ncbi:MAG: glycosyltransferase [Prevotellaceae bacterium]|nr:glycosyltransferase [Prevotellaceae bacterium]